MKRYLPRLAFVTLLLAGCGGDAPVEQRGQSGRVSAQRMGQLDEALPDQALQRMQPPGAIGRRSRNETLPPALAVDPQDREAVRVFFNGYYSLPAGALNWTGNYTAGVAGTVAASFHDATLRRLNWYRAMAGVPAMVAISPEYSEKAQHAALMMSAAGSLSHYPGKDWKLYSELGAQGAGNSNLSLLHNGPDAVDAYIQDYGGTNYFVGHRRHLLRPTLRTIGSGDVPAMTINGVSYAGANALWISDGTYSAPRPPVRDGYIAWPSAGYVPYQTVFQRWSFSLPQADFSEAKVTVSKAGVPVAVAVEPVLNGYADNTLVWKLSDAPAYGAYPRPAADIRYTVTVSNIAVGGQRRSHTYDVVMFDPAAPTPGRTETTLAAPPLVRHGQEIAVVAAPTAAASAYELQAFRSQPLNGSLSPFSTGWVTSNGGSHAMVAGSQFRFRHTTSDFGPQVLRIARGLVAAPGASLSFTRSTGFITQMQTFRVQVSHDDGLSWIDAYSKAGQQDDDWPTRVTVPLGQHAGRHLRLRMLFDLSPGGSLYADERAGWSVSDIGFSGVDELVDEQRYASVGTTFSLAAMAPGRYLLAGRAQYQSRYFGDFGPTLQVIVDGAILRGPRATYTLTRTGGVLTIVDNKGGDGTQTVQQPFRLAFTDLTLAFDVDGTAGQAYRLYRAAFNRVPDQAGLGFWIGALDGGMKLAGMAGGFTGSAEFKTLYGAAPTHAQLITAAYANVLHRQPDAAGLDYWLTAMQGGMPVEELLLAFSESAENKAQVASEVALGIAYVRP